MVRVVAIYQVVLDVSTEAVVVAVIMVVVVVAFQQITVELVAAARPTQQMQTSHLSEVLTLRTRHIRRQELVSPVTLQV